jgi:hypothetical protein
MPFDARIPRKRVCATHQKIEPMLGEQAHRTFVKITAGGVEGALRPQERSHFDLSHC